MTAWQIFWSNPEVWGILVTLALQVQIVMNSNSQVTSFFQDGPFLGMRMYIMFGRDVFNPTMIFFTVKNTIVLLLDTYRLAVIKSFLIHLKNLFQGYCDID